MIKIIIKIFLVLMCMITIFLLSSDSGSISTKKSDTIILKIYRIFNKRKISNNKKKSVINRNVVFVRKSAHFIIYFLLGLSLISLIKEFRLININSILIALFVAFLYACSDEVHQMFVPGRSCELFDIFIDSVGSFIGIYIYYLFYRFRRRKV